MMVDHPVRIEQRSPGYQPDHSGRRRCALEEGGWLTLALEAARGEHYAMSPSLAAALDRVAAQAVARRQLLDDVVEDTSATARMIAPVGLAEGSHEWQQQWRDYFALHDAIIGRTIRSYVVVQASSDSKGAEPHEPQHPRRA